MKSHTLPPGKYILRWKSDAGLYRKDTIEIHHTKEASEARRFDAQYLNSGGAWDWSLQYDAVPVGQTDPVPATPSKESAEPDGSAKAEKAKPQPKPATKAAPAKAKNAKRAK